MYCKCKNRVQYTTMNGDHLKVPGYNHYTEPGIFPAPLLPPHNYLYKCSYHVHNQEVTSDLHDTGQIVLDVNRVKKTEGGGEAH
jgi:hypothetical protein